MTEQKKLIIWDFDGVLSDSEHLWVEVWYQALIELRGITLTPDEVQRYLTGLSIKSKQEYLNTYFDARIDDEFINQALQKELDIIDAKLEPMADVEQVLKDDSFNHCLATGGTMALTERKLKKIGLWDKYIKKECCFTSEMVQHGKPAPDLFLYAADKMGYALKDCIIIEDSLNGIKAALAADIKVIAFIGAQNNHTKEYAATCQKAGAWCVAENMQELHRILKSIN